MIIECPHCLTRFRLDDERISRGRPLLKCSRCQHVFPPPEPAPPARRAGPPTRPVPGAEESLSFPFGDDEEWEAGPPPAHEIPEEPFSLTVEPAPAQAATRESLPRPVAATDLPDLPEERDVEDVEEDFEDDDMEAGAGNISLRPVFVFLILVVAAYAALARTLYANPDWAQQITRGLPAIGTDVRDRTLSRNVALIGVQGHYERSKEGKLVFLVMGQAHNQSAVSLTNVQVVTRIFDHEDHQIDQQVSFCGNSIRRELVHDLTVRQIAILKGLKPPPRFTIQPGEKCPVAGIFTDLPGTVGNFTTEVTAAQRQV